MIVSFLTLFGIIAAHVMTETARDALFLASLPAEHLPFVYLAVAVVSFFILGQVMQATRHSLAATLGIAAAATIGLWFLIDPGRTWTLYLLYVWSGVFGTLAGVQFWLLLARIFTVSEAKRLYALIGVGSVIGAAAGAGVTAALTLTLPPRDLVLIAGGILLVTATLPMQLRIPQDGPRHARKLRPDPRDCVRTIAGHPYIRRLFLFVVVGTVVLTLVDFIFKVEVKAQIAPEELATFFGVFYAVVNAAALLAQLLLTGWVLRRMGVLRALWILPIIVMGGAGLVALGVGLVGAMVLKGADGSLKHSLNRTATEVLYLPIPERLRRHSKAFIDVMGQRGSQALASLGILALLALGATPVVLAVVAIGLGLLWLWLASTLQGRYLDLFRDSLREGAIETRVAFPELDLQSVEALMRALNSDADDEVLAALSLLAGEGKAALIPALILHHPAEEVVLRALDIFAAAGRSDHLRLADRLFASGTPTIRAAALRGRAAADPDTAQLERAADDAQPLVRATALVGLVAIEARDSATVSAVLCDLVEQGDTATRMAVAQALAAQPTECLIAPMLALARCPEPEVQIAAATAMAASGCHDGVGALIPMLASRSVRGAARDALVQLGPSAVDALFSALENTEIAARIRLHIPRTLSRFPAHLVAQRLLAWAQDEPEDDVRHKILRGLGRLRAENPALHLDPAALDRGIDGTLRDAFTLVAWRVALEEGAGRSPERRTPGHELLGSLLRDRGHSATEHLFRWLGLRFPHEDFERIYRGASGTDRKAQSSAVELLDNVLPPTIRASVTALVAPLSDRERLAQGSLHAGAVASDGYEALLGALIESPHESTRALAAYHAGELRLTALEPTLRAIQVREDGYGRRVIARALRLFDPPAPQAAHAG